MNAAVLPGGTIGILGGGQLGRMSAIAARRLGYRVIVYTNERDCPAGQVADQVYVGAWDDVEQLRAFAQAADVATFEFENVSAEAAELVQHSVTLHPSTEVLRTTQRRALEKNFLRQLRIPVAEFRVLPANAQPFVADGFPFPAILKSSLGGYDGKGQLTVSSAAQLDAAYGQLGAMECVLEQQIELAAELSVVGVRDARGAMVVFGPIQNVHRNHILDLSWLPAEVPHQIDVEAQSVTRAILEHLHVVGVLCVEFFLDKQGRLLVNELAPRPHNSGHLTIDAHDTCQFEQHVRAICGLPLGSVRQWRAAAMANLLGDLWSEGTPRWDAALALDDVKLHLYGKTSPLVGRKMGHLTALADNVEQARALAQAARAALTSGRARQVAG